jgi:hypothetical protein
MQKKTYGDKQREAQQLKKEEEARARAAKNSPAPDSSKTPAEKRPKADKLGRRPA